MPKTSVTKEAMTSNTTQPDLTALITLLITEIKETLSKRIDQLSDRIDQQIKENELLRSENQNLRAALATQQQQMTMLKNVNTGTATDPGPNTSRNLQQHDTQTTTQQQRGIKAFNLIIQCPKPKVNDTNPKEFVENLLLNHFNRKLTLNSVHPLPTRGRQSAATDSDATPRINEELQDHPLPTRGRQSAATDSDATPRKNEELQETEMWKLLITLQSVWDVRQIYRERIQVLRNTGIYIQEDLTKENSFLFYQARKLKKKKIIVNTWTQEGEVYFKEKQDSTPKLLNPNDTILCHLQQEPSTSTSDPTFDTKKQSEITERMTRRKATNIKIQ